jgi:uncharacterized protein (DUF342 family)
MKVEAGNAIEIEKNVERANILAKGNIAIKGNLIMSVVCAGGEDVIVLNLLNDLKNLKASLKSIVDAIEEIKKFNLLGQNTTDGEMIKVLIENKFKQIPKLCASIIKAIVIENREEPGALICSFREKLVGMAPLGIRHFGELDSIIELIDEKIEHLEGSLALPVNINVAYCQDSSINSSGDIFITGKGEYVSNIISHKGIYFTEEKSVARGGTLEAKSEIKCKVVGSTGGVATKLIVEDKGHIWADVAFPNTFFSIGPKEYVMDVPSKNVHVYVNDAGELTVDKLKLDRV